MNLNLVRQMDELIHPQNGERRWCNPWPPLLALGLASSEASVLDKSEAAARAAGVWRFKTWPWVKSRSG